MKSVKSNPELDEIKMEITPPLIKSKSVQTRILEHKFQVQDEIRDNTWKSCCMELDRRAVQYFTQIAIIGGCMSFSIYQLLTLTECGPQQTYISLLTLMIGLLMPNPKFTDKETKPP